MRWWLVAALASSANLACGAAPARPAAEAPSGTTPARPAQATCPVMGETFTPSDETEYAEYKGVTYWFCCRGCRGKFLAEPEKYLQAAAERGLKLP
ncbi:MAG: YHS domain-containing protein [Deltaproteobacteria bacterium]|nr:YHS domain-containing protein [Deltaproteobacteria bacterium]